MKRHLSKKERKQAGTTHARKAPKQKFLDVPGNKGGDYYITVKKAGKKDK